MFFSVTGGVAHLVALSLLLKCRYISPQWQGLVQLLFLEGEPGDGVLKSMLKTGAALTVLTQGPANESRGDGQFHSLSDYLDVSAEISSKSAKCSKHVHLIILEPSL